MHEQKIERMNLMAMGYVTHLLYVLIVSVLALLTEPTYSPVLIIGVILIPALIAMTLSTRIIRKHQKIRVPFKDAVIKMSLVQIISMIGLITAFVLLNAS